MRCKHENGSVQISKSPWRDGAARRQPKNAFRQARHELSDAIRKTARQAQF